MNVDWMALQDRLTAAEAMLALAIKQRDKLLDVIVEVRSHYPRDYKVRITEILDEAIEGGGPQ